MTYQKHRDNRYCTRMKQFKDWKLPVCGFSFPRLTTDKLVLLDIPTAVAGRRNLKANLTIYRARRENIDDHNPAFLLAIGYGNMDLQFVGEKTGSVVRVYIVYLVDRSLCEAAWAIRQAQTCSTCSVKLKLKEELAIKQGERETPESNGDRERRGTGKYDSLIPKGSKGDIEKQFIESKVTNVPAMVISCFFIFMNGLKEKVISQIVEAANPPPPPREPALPAYGPTRYGVPAYGPPRYGEPAYGPPRYGVPTYAPTPYGPPADGLPPGTWYPYGDTPQKWPILYWESARNPLFSESMECDKNEELMDRKEEDREFPPLRKKKGGRRR
ncbi:unnamed protein product [Bemisia tabaci]|uniref:Uncharacterized protein n=1 Tax=Bemisia tabaci TaxID=7038 RepID=A0A9P0AHL4_BEMTA|nr:unnamed protein product [Bemisia tabaci]